jgi:hypothetical protein
VGDSSLWRTAGARQFDLGGGGAYKMKYGGLKIPTAHFYRSRWHSIRAGRSAARRLAGLAKFCGHRRSPSARKRAADQEGREHAGDAGQCTPQDQPRMW